MDIKTTIPITEARKHIFDIAKKVQYPGTHFTLTENGRPKVVITSAQDYEMLQTLTKPMRAVIPTNAEIRAIEEGRKAYAKGEYVTLDQLFHDLDTPRRRTGR